MRTDVSYPGQLALGEWTLSEGTTQTPVPQITAPHLTSLEELRPPSPIINTLCELDWTFATADTAYLTHDLHPYAAKFIPQLPATLIGGLSLRGETVWDPFGGSGTTALESALRYRHAISSDANPLAQYIGRAKTTTLTREDSSSLVELRDRVLILSRSRRAIADLSPRQSAAVAGLVPPIPNIYKWFAHSAVEELALIKFLLSELSGGAKCVALCTFSKIVLRSSKQDSETRYSSREREFASGDVLRLFASELTSAATRVAQVGAWLQFRTPTFLTADLRESIVGKTGDHTIRPESVSLIVTSPPYPNAMDYHLYHRFRLYWLGYDPSALAKIEIGSHLRHQREASGIDKYLDEMRPCLSNCYEALQPGRYACFVVGDARYQGVDYSTAELLRAVAITSGFEVVASIARTLPETRRSFVPGARRAHQEDVLILRKPDRHISVSLLPLPYKPWPYEAILRSKEAAALVGPVTRRGRDGTLGVDVDAYRTDALRRLVFTHRASLNGDWQVRTWQAFIENGDLPGTRKEPKYVTHALHPYKGKFYPQLAKALFNLAALRPESLVVDPFCGSGTVLLEAKLNGLRAMGFDINPLAVEIAQAKCEVLDEDPVVVDRLLGGLSNNISRLAEQGAGAGIDVFSADTHAELRAWFPSKVISKLAACVQEVSELPAPKVRKLARVVMSSVVRDVSFQDPQDLRIRRRKVPIADAPVYEDFLSRIADTRSRLRAFAAILDRSPWRMQPAIAVHIDSRQLNSVRSELEPLGGLADAIVTSPPYATALPYVDTYRLNMLVVLGLTAEQRQGIETNTVGTREIRPADRRRTEEVIATTSAREYGSDSADRFVRRLLAENRPEDVGFRRLNMASLVHRYFLDMRAALASMDRILRPCGAAFLVVGDNQTTTGAGPVAVPTTKVIGEMAKGIGWRLEDALPITVTPENLRHTKNSISRNTVLYFRKV